MSTDTVAAGNAHLADDELLRFIDGEEDVRRSVWESHVRQCAHCAREVELLRGHSLVVHDWLERAAFEAGADADAAAGVNGDAIPISSARARRERRTAPSPWIRAAVLVLLASPLAAMPSVRQWVVATVGEIRGEAPATTAAAVDVQAPADNGAIRFVPSAGTFRVEFDVRQQSGTLAVRHGAGYEAVLQVTGTGVEPVISAAALRLRNVSALHASYTLQVPASVARVVVGFEDGDDIVIDAAGLTAGVQVDLQR